VLADMFAAMSDKPQWALDLEAKHGLPIDQIPGAIYALCYDPAVIVQAVSTDYAGPSPQRNGRGLMSATPIRHYVGWSQQADPKRRISKHHNAGTPVTISVVGQGTLRDEHRTKLTGKCAVCGEPYRDYLAIP
jgi:hypothetical protein